jgi:uncharacterized membrane protein YdjX (TVP38/TMEM64 family)
LSARRTWLLLGVGALALAGFVALRRALGIEFDPQSLQQAVAGLGIWGPLVYVGIVAFRAPLGLPSGVVLLGGGLAFGALTATLCGAVGLTLSAIATFLAARLAGRASIEARLPERMRPLIELAGSRLGAVAVSVGTAYPFGPVTLFCLLAGVTRMALAVFVVEGGARGALEGAAVMAVAIVIPLLIPRTRRWFFAVLRAREPREPEPR